MAAMTAPLPPAIADQLPDTRNLGVLLRVLLTANLVALLIALAAVPKFDAALARFVEDAALLEPALLLVMAALALLRDPLRRLPYRQGTLACVVLAALGALAVRAMLSPFYPAEPGQAWRAAGFAAVLAAGLLGYFRLRSRALSPLLTIARLQALQARIRPHFLFNSLNAVLSLIRGEPRKAERALEDLADLFRVFMAENLELSPLGREVELAGQYLGIEALRLGERLRVEWHTEKMPHDALIPPLTLQPLLENAVYHGIEPSISPGVITINIYRARDEVHVDIRNPYYREGGRHHAGNKMAMGNIRERLMLHFDAEASLKTTVGSDYYQVHITLPYTTGRDVRHARHAQSISGR